MSDRNESEHEAEVPSITHSVIFKCISVTKENRYQELLALAKRKLNNGDCSHETSERANKNCYDLRQ